MIEYVFVCAGSSFAVSMVKFEDLKIVFFGTPEFAVGSLRALVDAGANIVGVVTAPDKPAGRGMQLQSSAIKIYADSHNISTLQPEKLKNAVFINELASYHADLFVVVAFRMLPEAVWNMPPLGTINVHASLLPQYRGAAPINWAIINGERETGVTTFKLQHEIDTGNILLQQKVPVAPEDNAGILHDKLMNTGAELLVKTVKGLADSSIRETSQEQLMQSELKHAPKIFKEYLHIDWNKSAENIHNLIRGLSPYPAAFTSLAGKSVKIFQSHYIAEHTGNNAGMYETDGKTYLRFAASDGWLYVDELQMEGKKKMDIVSFLRGFRM
jgi:methionyl-tRNA formyltransferase